MNEYRHDGYVDFLEVTFMEVSPDDQYILYLEFSDGSSGKSDVSVLASMPIFRDADKPYGSGSGWWLDDGCPCWGEQGHVDPELFKRRLEPMTYFEWERDMSLKYDMELV